MQNSNKLLSIEFTREEVMRKSLLEGDKYIDGYRWGILSDEWKNG